MSPRLKQRLLEWAAVLTLAMSVLVQLPVWFPVDPQPDPDPTAIDAAWQAVAIPVLDASAGPRVAAHLLLPEGWTTSGGLRAVGPPPFASPAADCIALPLACLQWSARSADGLHGVDFLPARTWTRTAHTAHAAWAEVPMSATESSLRALALDRHPGAEVVGYTADASLLRGIPRPVTLAGGHFEAGRLRVRYRHEGRDWQETLTAIVLLFPQDAGLALDGMAFPSNAGSGATFVVFHALDVPGIDAERIRLSLRFDRGWLAYRDRNEAIRRCTDLEMECPRMRRDE